MKYISLFIATTLFLFSVSTVSADQVCVQSYGQPVSCGTNVPEYHVPVKAGLGDINIKVLGFGFIVASGVIYLKSRKNISS